jgi:hypothetical protein
VKKNIGHLPHKPAPLRGWFRECEVSGDNGALAAEPGGGVRNRVKGANCLSAASAGWSSQPAVRLAGFALRRMGQSQRPGCLFLAVRRRPHSGFFSLGTQRKECPCRQGLQIVVDCKLYKLPLNSHAYPTNTATRFPDTAFGSIRATG